MDLQNAATLPLSKDPETEPAAAAPAGQELPPARWLEVFLSRSPTARLTAAYTAPPLLRQTVDSTMPTALYAGKSST